MKLTKILLISLLGFLSWGCSDDDNYSPEEMSLNFFYLKSKDGAQYRAFYVNDSTIHFVVPKSLDLNHVGVELSSKSDSIIDKEGYYINSNILDLSDFVHPHSIISHTDGKRCCRKIIIYDLPVLIINTPDSLPIVSKEERTEGCEIKLVDADNCITELGTAGVRGRGNSSWDKPKKPYNIKLDKKASILGMKKSKHWLLIANAWYDRTQLHNHVALEMARMTDYPWIPENRFVELILNGEHKGLYGLYEKIRVEGGKIEIEEINPTEWGGQFFGGYLLEETMTPDMTENSFSTTYFNWTGYNDMYQMGWEIKSPNGTLPGDLIDSIRTDINKIEELIYNEETLLNGKYREAFDIESAIDWLLVELTANNDEMARSKNIFMYKENRNSKLKIGPTWDFDFGTFDTNTIFDFDYHVNTALYYRKLKYDHYFCQRVKEKWAKYRPIWVEKIPHVIDNKYKEIKRSAERNERLWTEWLNPSGTYEEHVNKMKNSFFSNIDQMESKIGSFGSDSITES